MKHEIRRAMREKNLAMTQSQRDCCANEIFSIIETLDIFKKAATIALYSSLRDELPTHGAIERWRGSKRIFLPRIGKGFDMEFYPYESTSVEVGAFGILEPQCAQATPCERIDLIIVPGVAFTAAGARLGRGKGYYDRYLSRTGCRAYTIGVGYVHQILDTLPCEEHDVALHKVVSCLR